MGKRDKSKSNIPFLPRRYRPGQPDRKDDADPPPINAGPADGDRSPSLSTPPDPPETTSEDDHELPADIGQRDVEPDDFADEPTAADDRASKSEDPQDAPDFDESEQSDEPVTVKVRVVGVRFGYAGKIYHFDCGDEDLNVGDWVIVKTEKGVGLARIVMGAVEREYRLQELEGLRKILRKAEKVDFDQQSRCEAREAQARAYCQERIEALTLPMKLVSVECFFDGSKYVFYFTADGRVDFRELVKHLVARFPVRIEMRQIGVRHEAKMIGGLGCCGQELCCARFLTDFKPVSVRMAKNQNLSLNPSKISGVCGRLMCCLSYEHEIYEQFKKGLPKVGKPVVSSKGSGVVVKVCPLKEIISVRIDEETIIDVRKDDIETDAEQGQKRRSSKSADGGGQSRRKSKGKGKRGKDAN